MDLTSSALIVKGRISPRYTCDGANINPPLLISNVPEGTKSLVLIMDDPDAVIPAGKVWDHWVVFNIPPYTKEIPEGEAPKGIRGKGTSGNLDYKGPCPPDRVHRYFFKLYALDTGLGLPEGSSKEEVEAAMKKHILARAELMGRYEKQK
ncbi:MAG: YbhB/YbcL family Raf kinase inhibitor-like protein [Nanoarchaeota archaeon]